MQTNRYPLVDIVLATYNGEMFLREQLDSIIGQTYTNWKLYVRDDGSTDGTLDIVKDYLTRFPGKIQMITDQDKNLGSTNNFMRLLESATANYIMLCDQDDIWMNTKVSRSVERILEMETQFDASSPLMVFTDLTVIDGEGKILHSSFWNAQRLSPNITEKIYRIVAQNVVTGCTMIFNQAALRASIPKSVKEFQHDHWISICTAYFGHIGYLTEPTILYRIHGRNHFGLKQPTVGYLTRSINKIKDNLQIWQGIKAHTAIRFSIPAAFAFKLYFNVKRGLQQLRGSQTSINEA